MNLGSKCKNIGKILTFWHTWYLSQTPQTASVENKLVMWRNSPYDMLEKFLHMRYVEKICQVEKFST